MAKEKMPGGILTVGVLNIVFGSLCAFCGTLGVIFKASGSDFLGNEELERQLIRFLEQSIPAFQVLDWAFDLGSLVLHVLMVIAGIGLVNRSAWARSLAMVNSGILVVFYLSRSVFHFAFLAPNVVEFLRNQNIPDDDMGFFWINVLVAGLEAVLMITLATVALCVLLGERARAFFTGKSFNADSLYGDDDWDDRPRGRDGW